MSIEHSWNADDLERSEIRYFLMSFQTNLGRDVKAFFSVEQKVLDVRHGMEIDNK